MQTDHLPLFAFGTLRRGEENHHLLADRYERVVAARLPGYATVAPLMIDRSESGTVPGELFFLRPRTYDATLNDCDDLEGIPLGRMRGVLYERRRVRVLTDIGPHDAWAYVNPSDR